MRNLLISLFIVTVGLSAQEKKETVSFSKDVMPVFVKRCLSCHNTEDESPSLLYLDNYKQLMSGESKHGPVVIPKKGDESILVKKLRGTTDFGRLMPRGRKPLDEETILMISRWIDQGAKNN